MEDACRVAFSERISQLNGVIERVPRVEGAPRNQRP